MIDKGFKKANLGRPHPAGASTNEPTRWFALLQRRFGAHAFALADQAIVSGGSFLTTVLVGRNADSIQLGVYAIGSSLLVSSMMIQESLIVLPYMIYYHEADSALAARAGSSLTHSGALSMIGLFLLAAAGVGLPFIGANAQFEPMIWALVGVLPFFMLRDFVRRLAFAELKMARALTLDAAVATILVTALAWLAETGRMSAATAFAAIGVACAIPVGVWLYHHRREFVFERRAVQAELKKNWGMGRWLLAGQTVVQAESYAAYWLSLLLIGATSTGIFAACASIVAFANPFITAFRNILTPRAVKAWKRGGGKALRAQAMQDSALLIAGTGAFCLVVVEYGGELLRLLYHNSAYAGHDVLVDLLALGLVSSALGMPASNGLAAIQRPRLIAVTGAIGAAVTISLVWVLTAHLGLPGTGYGILIGSLVGSCGRWLALFIETAPPRRVPAAVAEVLHDFAPNRSSDSVELERLGEGTYAVVYAARSRAQEPSEKAHEHLVIKLFKPEASLNLEKVRTEARALSDFKNNFTEQPTSEWRTLIPECQHVCKTPLAMIMTEVRGRNLYAWTRTGDGLLPDVLKKIAAATTGAMTMAWARGKSHGDFALQNILCDLENKTIAFIDVGTAESCFVCNSNAAGWPPAVRDISHLLSDVGTDVKRSIGNRSARKRRQAFVAGAMGAFLDTIGPHHEKRKWLDEIEKCAGVHLKDLLKLSWSPQGLWCRIVLIVAARRIAALIGDQRAEIEASQQSGPRNGDTLFESSPAAPAVTSIPVGPMPQSGGLHEA